MIANQFQLAASFAIARKRQIFAAFSLSLAAALINLPAAFCDPQLKMPANPNQVIQAQKARPSSFEDDIILVMPAAGADQDDINQVLQEVHGTVVGTIGEGAMTVLKIKAEKGKLDETEQKLSKDKNFSTVQRNYRFFPQYRNLHIQRRTRRVGNPGGGSTIAPPSNDPYYPQEWHLQAINAAQAWQVSKGGPQAVLGLLDTGTNNYIPDLNGKCLPGFNAVTLSDRQNDSEGHGTMTATTFGAITDNRVGTAALARSSPIYPIRIVSIQGYATDEALINAIRKCAENNIKIINLSFNADPPYTLASKRYNAILHNYMKWYHDEKGGLIFNSAGNSGTVDTNPKVPYLIVISAVDTNLSPASFTTYGTPVWFTGPGTNIYCSDKNGAIVAVAGTSFSSPICASVAALIWGANPNLKNTDVERVLINTTTRASNGAQWTPYFGYGMPDAYKAIKAVVGN
jgi:subtilisin family serine protease